MTKKKVLSVGEMIWDVFGDKSVIGGAPLNFAAHASLCGMQSALLSTVGYDKLGDDAINTLGEFGVSCKYIKKVSQPTGQCIVTLDKDKVPSYNVLFDVAYDNIKVTRDDIESINAEHFDALYFGTLIQRTPVSRRAVWDIVENCSFSDIICDVNLRPDCYDSDSVESSLSHASILKVSIEEEPTLRSFGGYAPESDTNGDIARALCKSYKNIKIVIITLGKDGSYAYDAKSQAEYTQAPIGDKVVSTVGAGDSFAAAWLSEYLNGKPIEECMKKAAEISGFVVAHTEAVPRY